jgi:carbon monoxide dehydrogenase subunit G
MGLLVQTRAWVSGFAALLTCTCVPAVALAATELTDSEIARLNSGVAVVREQTVERGGRRYVGGLAYVLIDAPPEQVMGTLEDVGSYVHVLPATRQVRWLGVSRAGETIVQLDQGTPLVHGRYVVRTRLEKRANDATPMVVRFWLDARFPHDIADATGYFQAEPRSSKTLLTYGAWVDLGPGLLNRFLEGRVRRAALSAPARVKSYVEALGPFG